MARKPEDTPENGTLRYTLIKWTAVLGLISGLGSAIDGAFNNWKFAGAAASQVYIWLSLDCSNPKNNKDINRCIE